MGMNLTPHSVTRHSVAALTLVLLGSRSLAAQAPSAGAALDFFVGQWEVTVLDEQGQVTGRARTHAYHILDGHAIQDDWRSLDRNGNVIFRGTSIRTYNPATAQWIVHWAMANTPGYTYIDAEWRDGELHGDGRGFDPRGDFAERYRYYDITADSYSFRLERSYDGGGTWEFMSELRARKEG